MPLDKGKNDFIKMSKHSLDRRTVSGGDFFDDNEKKKND